MSRQKRGIVFKRDAFRELRNDPRIRADVLARARRVAAEASEGGRVKGYKVTDLVLEESRAAASVMATYDAHRHNLDTNALIRALDAGKG